MRWICGTLVVVAALGAVGNPLSDLETAFASQTGQWFGRLESSARWLLLSLAAVSVAWSGIQMALRQADLGEFLSDLVRQVLFVGFFLLLLSNAEAWTAAIVQSFAVAAGIATGGGTVAMNAAEILNLGVSLADRIWNAANPLNAIPMGMAALVVVVIYGAIAAYVLMVMAEMYVVTAAGSLLLGFGGSAWTVEYAKRYITYTLSVGAKLYALFLVVGTGGQFLDSWVFGVDVGLIDQMFGLIGVLFIMLMLVVTIPNMVQGIINGSSIGSGGAAITGMVSGVANMAGGAALAAVRGGAAVGQAASLTAAQAGAGGVKEALAGGLTKGQLAGGMARNMAAGLAGQALGKVLGQNSLAGQMRGERMSMPGPTGTPRGAADLHGIGGFGPATPEAPAGPEAGAGESESK